MCRDGIILNENYNKICFKLIIHFTIYYCNIIIYITTYYTIYWIFETMKRAKIIKTEEKLQGKDIKRS